MMYYYFGYCVIIFLFFSFASEIDKSLPEDEKDKSVPEDGEDDVFVGRYTEDVEDYELVVPRKVNSHGEFVTYSIPNHYEHDYAKRRRKRDATHPDVVHYGIIFNGQNHLVELWPNHGFMSPDIVVESHGEDADVNVNSRLMRTLKPKQCHYTGTIRGHDGSRAALSLCDGLAGYLRTSHGNYYIEPVKGHTPNAYGQLLHLVHQTTPEGLRKQKFTDSENRYSQQRFASEDDISAGKSMGYPLEEEVDNERGPRSTLSNQCGVKNWGEGWAERFRRELSKNPSSQGNQTAGHGTDSVHRYLETLVVADKRFLDYHKDADHETYILTVMNMVSDFYHDASAGNQMDVVIVRIIYLEKEKKHIDLVINPDADKTLDSFCKWQQGINTKEITHPNHHDIAVLLTRYDICSDNMKNCDLMGLAFVSAACTGDRPCAINEDSGLVLGIVVAHEMGHVMGCAHDTKEESGCEPKGKDSYYHVMSPYVHLDTGRWSACSQTFITVFFENNLGECLNDEPQESKYKETGMLPGAMYDATYQCNLAFPDSKICVVDQAKFCEVLYCQKEPNSCMSKGEPPADGTKCGDNKWCYRHECVEAGQRPGAVAGGWGEWGEWGPCSRTCGGGAMTQERQCNNPVPKHKGRYCLGQRKRSKVCNTDLCDQKAPSFRTVQCSEFNDKPFRDEKHTWTPYFPTSAADPCALYCINKKRMFVKLAPRVKDGTPCRRGTKDMCVQGSCMKVGCDWMLGSTAAEDICGVCNGQGTECTRVEKYYREAPGRGYVPIVTVPAGSRNIMVVELEASENTLAISKPDNTTFYLNGQNRENTDGEKDFGGVFGVYTHPEPGREEVVIPGPTKEDLVLHIVYYSKTNPGIKYAFSSPATGEQSQQPGSSSTERTQPRSSSTERTGSTSMKPQDQTATTAGQPRTTSATVRGKTTEANGAPNYHWEFTEWGDCSVKCGGGISKAAPTCIEEARGKVSDQFCRNTDNNVPENQVRVCNAEPCKTKWRVGTWGPCSGCTFRSGVRKRKVECVHQAPRWDDPDVVTDPGLCTKRKPGNRQLCSVKRKCSASEGKDADRLMPGADNRYLHRETRSPYEDLWKHLIYTPLGKEWKDNDDEDEDMESDDQQNDDGSARRLKDKEKIHQKQLHSVELHDRQPYKSDAEEEYSDPERYHRDKLQEGQQTYLAGHNLDEASGATQCAGKVTEPGKIYIENHPSSALMNKSINTVSGGNETNGAGVNGAGANGAGANGAGSNGADVNGTCVTGAGVNGTCVDGAGVPCKNEKETDEVAPDKSKVEEYLKKMNGSSKDYVPPEEIKLIKVPFKAKSDGRFSDETFEKLGYDPGNQFNMAKKHVYTGKEASEMMKTKPDDNCSLSQEN